MEEIRCQIGVDEAGRGALMGPVFGAAVLFHPLQIANWENAKNPFWLAIRDSKTIKHKRSDNKEIPQEMVILSHWIKENALFWAEGSSSIYAIEEENILQATISTWHACLQRFPFQKDGKLKFPSVKDVFHKNHESLNLIGSNELCMKPTVLVDGTQFRPFFVGDEIKLQVPHECIIKGDSLHKCISAAGILAKVARDTFVLTVLSPQYPLYGWEKNKGYGTHDHLEAIAKHGVTSAHRQFFKGVVEHVKKDDGREDCPR